MLLSGGIALISLFNGLIGLGGQGISSSSDEEIGDGWRGLGAIGVGRGIGRSRGECDFGVGWTLGTRLYPDVYWLCWLLWLFWRGYQATGELSVSVQI